MRRFLSILILILTLVGCGGRSVIAPEPRVPEPSGAAEPLPPAEAPEETAPESAPTEADAEAETVQKLLDGLTTEQKVGQLFFACCAEPDMAEKIARLGLGGVLLFGPDYKDASGAYLTEAAFTAKLGRYQAAALDGCGIPLFIGSDEEGGTVTRASRNPNLFPAKLLSPQALYKAGGMTGLLTDTLQYNDRLRALGVNVNFAPVADVSADPKDFIYARAFGQDAAATADYVSRVVGVMRTAEIGSVLKHFPGYGNNADTHTGVAIDERPFEKFQTEDLLPFAAGIEAGAPFVLVSHNVVTCMDAERPASLSPAVHELLRGELGFDGVILTDDLGMGAVKAYAESGGAAVMALLAGNDMLVSSDFEAQIAGILDAARTGAIPAEVIDAAARRVLTAKLRLGLMGE